MFDLPHLKSLSIQGPDALAFGQSQITANMDHWSPHQWYPSAWCNAQGKVRAVVLVRVTDNRMDWVAPTSQIDQTLKDLRPFAIGRRVEFGEPGPVFGEFGVKHSDPLAFDQTRGLSLQPPEALGSQTKAVGKDAHLWQQADIAQGLAWLAPELNQQFLPQALGLERLGGLSYQKGCYPGQEVIAKVHYRGKPKHQLMLITWTGSTPSLGDAIHLAYHEPSDPHEPSDQSVSRPIGTLLSAVDGSALAVIGIEHPPEINVRFGMASGRTQALQPLTNINPVS